MRPAARNFRGPLIIILYECINRGDGGIGRFRGCDEKFKAPGICGESMYSVIPVIRNIWAAGKSRVFIAPSTPARVRIHFSDARD